MADSNQITSNPVAQTADSQREPSGGTSEVIPICRNTRASGSEGHCPLWDGHIVDATFPPV